MSEMPEPWLDWTLVGASVTLAYNFFLWILGFTLVYAMLFGVGDLLFGRIAPAQACWPSAPDTVVDRLEVVVGDDCDSEGGVLAAVLGSAAGG
jgi:hypothetical protein